MAISLESISRDVRIKAPRIAMYGVGGVGKTEFAAGAPKPIFMFTEDQPHLGPGGLDVAYFQPRKDDPILRSWAEIIDCIGVLYNEKHDYQTVVLDTLDFAEPLLWKHTCQLHNQPDIEAFGYGKGYIYAVDEARILFQGLDALRIEKNMTVILLAHSETKRYAVPDHEPYDRYRMRLQSKLGDLVHDWCDTMLFANWKEHVVKDVQGKGKSKKETARGVGKGERVMYTEERPPWLAKNRYKLPEQLPLGWSYLQDAMAANMVPAKTNPVSTSKAKKE